MEWKWRLRQTLAFGGFFLSRPPDPSSLPPSGFFHDFPTTTKHHWASKGRKDAFPAFFLLLSFQRPLMSFPTTLQWPPIFTIPILPFVLLQGCHFATITPMPTSKKQQQKRNVWFIMTFFHFFFLFFSIITSAKQTQLSQSTFPFITTLVLSWKKKCVRAKYREERDVWGRDLRTKINLPPIFPSSPYSSVLFDCFPPSNHQSKEYSMEMKGIKKKKVWWGASEWSEVGVGVFEDRTSGREVP